MDTQENQNAKGIASLKGTPGADNNSFEDFEVRSADTSDNPVADDARAKKEKEDRYFDDKENPRTHYNVNDQAHSQSSKEDFVKTVSNFKHTDGHTEADNDYPEQVPD